MWQKSRYRVPLELQSARGIREYGTYYKVQHHTSNCNVTIS